MKPATLARAGVPATWGALPAAIPVAIVGAWVLALAAEASGTAAFLHHDALIDGGQAAWIGLPAFLLAWQVMIVAMMLPSSLPLVRLFNRAAANQPRPRAAMAGFLGGYAVVWTAFGALALLFDVLVHAAVGASPWLEDHAFLLAGGVLVLAGGFQFTALKDRCLDKCRHPAMFLRRYYERGTGGGFRFGLRHGLFCLGCCWAMMLVMFSVGVANLVWMATLGGLMVYEKTAQGGARSVPVTGVTLLAAGTLVCTVGLAA